MSNPAHTQDQPSQDALEAQAHEGIRAWVAEQLGGEVTSITRLERWRPQWKVCYCVGDQNSTILVRGDRPIAGSKDLRFEMEVMEVLEKNGIKVPHIYGWMESPKAFVMEWIETEDRAPGMLHTAIENPSTMSDQRWQAMLNYMGDLADVHAVPVSEFSHIRRLAKPAEMIAADPDKSAANIALHATERMYAGGNMMGKIDLPLEFLQHWLRRNVPAHRKTASFVSGDAGQFMSAGTEVLALLDFEIANIGDTHWDLACFRGRHPYENMGDIPSLYRHYEKVTGTEVDLTVVAYYTVAFLQLSCIGATFFTEPSAAGGNWIEGILEYASISRRAYEAIAELRGIELNYELTLPETVTKPWEDSGLSKLITDIDRLPTSSTFEPWERDLLGAIPRFLLNHARYRDWFEQQSVSDISVITGESYQDMAQADEAAKQAIANNNPAEDAAWVQAMHRRSLRLSMIVAGTNPDASNPLFHKLDPILNQQG